MSRGVGTIADPWEDEVRGWTSNDWVEKRFNEALYQAEKARKNMNMECRVAADFELRTTMRSIKDGLNDMEYWTPCQLSPLIAQGWVARVEAPNGGYYLELTSAGAAVLEGDDK